MLSGDLPEGLLDERRQGHALGAGVPLGDRKQVGVHSDGEFLLHCELSTSYYVYQYSIRVYVYSDDVQGIVRKGIVRRTLQHHHQTPRVSCPSTCPHRWYDLFCRDGALEGVDVSLAERALVIEDGKDHKHHEVPMRPNWPVFWPCI